MALNIKHHEADRLALKERLQRHTGRGDREALRRDLRRIQRHFVQGRDADAPTPDEIIAYDEWGLPS